MKSSANTTFVGAGGAVCAEVAPGNKVPSDTEHAAPATNRTQAFIRDLHRGTTKLPATSYPHGAI
jgi:hypothetical protein